MKDASPNAREMSPEAVEALLGAVQHLLRRIGQDPGGVGYYAGYGTEVFERSIKAYALAVGKSVDDVRTEVLAAQNLHQDLEAEVLMLRRRIESAEDRRTAAAGRRG